MRDHVVVDTRRMDKVRSVDPDGLAWVEAGATWNRVMPALREHGRVLCVHTTSQFSTVGGMVATGGFGLGSTAHGSIQDNVVEVEVATPEGVAVLPIAQAAHLFRTDGQLGIVTAVRLQTRPVPSFKATVVQHAPTYGQAVAAARQLANQEGIQTVLVYDAARVHELNALHDQALVPEEHTVIARFEADAPLVLPETHVEPHVAGLLWQQRHFPMRPLKMGPGLLGAEVLLPDDKAAPLADWASKALAPFNLQPANEAYVLPDGQVLQITTFLTDAAAGNAYTAHVAQVARITAKGVALGGIPYGGGMWNLPLIARRHPDLSELRARKRRDDPQGIMNPGKSLDPPARSSKAGALLRTPLGRWGPAMMRTVAPALRFTQRRIAPDSRDVAHPGATGDVLHPQLPMATAGTSNVEVLDAHEYSNQACTQCAACIPVCPAWMVTGDERTTARGKLQFMAQLAADPSGATAEEAAALYQCIRCRACEEVCQTDLPLLPAFDALEGKLTRQFGFPREKVTTFLQDMEASEEAQRLIDETRGVFRAPHATFKQGPSEDPTPPTNQPPIQEVP